MEHELNQVKQAFLHEITGNILPFWLNKGRDLKNGGYFGRIDFDGRVDQTAPRGAVLHARVLWTMAAAHRYLGKKEYLEAAEHAYAYISRHFINRKHGGLYWKIDHTGHPLETKNQVYALAFAIYAFSEYHAVSHREEVLDQAIKLFRLIEKYSYDARAGGYLEAFSEDWQLMDDLRLSELDDNEKKTLNTHLHVLEAYTSLYQVWPDPFLEHQLRRLVLLFLEQFPAADQGHFFLFYDESWNLKSNRISPGHDIETTWLLLEAARTLKDNSLVSRTEELAISIARSVLAQGTDESGALVYEREPGRVTSDSKEWWCLAEALVGFLNAWQISGDQLFSRSVLQMWRYIEKHFIDRVNGEWHFRVDGEGHPDRTEDKAGFWKGPYHSVRAGLELFRRLEETANYLSKKS